MDTLTFRAKCWTPEDRGTLDDLIQYCVFNFIQASMARDETHVTLSLTGEGEGFEKLKNYISDKFKEMVK